MPELQYLPVGELQETSRHNRSAEALDSIRAGTEQRRTSIYDKQVEYQKQADVAGNALKKTEQEQEMQNDTLEAITKIPIESRAKAVIMLSKAFMSRGLTKQAMFVNSIPVYNLPFIAERGDLSFDEQLQLKMAGKTNNDAMWNTIGKIMDNSTGKMSKDNNKPNTLTGDSIRNARDGVTNARKYKVTPR